MWSSSSGFSSFCHSGTNLCSGQPMVRWISSTLMPAKRSGMVSVSTLALCQRSMRGTQGMTSTVSPRKTAMILSR